MNTPFFSIVLPTYNRASFLPRSIGSVMNQGFNDWELIIIDDGSTDRTKEVVLSFDDSRIRYSYQENSERSAARNNGISKASGKWICFIDSDDEYLPEHLEVLYKHLQINNASRFVISGSYIQHHNEQKKHPLIDVNANVLTEIATKFILMNSICVDRNILQHERFKETYSIWEDTHLWLRIAAKYSIYQIAQYTVIQHIHDQGTVVLGMKKISLKEVVQYIFAIQDLRDNYHVLFEGKLPPNYFNQYIDSKYRMYLYQARQNRQFTTAFQISIQAWQHRPSWYIFTEFPKIVLNFFYFGLHAR